MVDQDPTRAGEQVEKSRAHPSHPRQPVVPTNKIRLADLKPEERLVLEQKFKDEIKMINMFEEEKNTSQVESQFFVGKVNYKESYYRTKFDCDALDVLDLRNNVRDFFVEGLMWNMSYYYQGCISWEWFYPFYYAPFPSDIINITHLQSKKFNYVRFLSQGSPF